MYESDYILRVIAQMGVALRRAVAALRTDPAEALRLAEDAVASAADAGLPLVDALSAEGLAAYLTAGGTFDVMRAVALARALSTRADAHAAGGDAAAAAAERARADALMSAAREADPDGTAAVLEMLDGEGAADVRASEPAAEPSLQAYGCSDRWRALFAATAGDGHILGRVVRSDRGYAFVATGEGTVRAEASAKLRQAARGPEDFPATGDWVVLDPAPEHEIPVIDAVLPRASAFMRGDPGKEALRQVLAANVDTVFIVHPIAEEPNLRRIERELALAWESGATPVVVLSKADLSDDPEAARSAVEEIAFGVDVRVESAVTGAGVDELREYARHGHTVALIGPSGVGKSHLINALVGSDVRATQDVRVADGKGRHTTVTRELVLLPGGGVLVDTPGMRALALTDSEDGIAAAFPEIERFAEDCRFRDCTHTSEPGCGVLAALERGELPPERLESYRKLIAEARAAAIRSDARLAAAEKRRWASINKSLREHHKYGGQL